MFFNIFGKFLIEGSYITEDDYWQIKFAEDKTRVKLGLIAVSEKLMTEAQADKVNRQQMSVDRRFGDIAIEMGFLTETQVKRLLSLQGNPYMQFCQTVTDLKIMTLQQIEKALVDFQTKNGFIASDIDDIKSGDVDRILPLYLPESADRFTRDLFEVAVRSANRLVSSDICLSKAYITNKYTTQLTACQNMVDGHYALTAISGDDKGMLCIAEGFGKEFFDVVNMEALDSVGEFVNIVNGLFATAKSNEGVEIDLLPPEYHKESICIEGDSICVLPIEIEHEKIDIVYKSGK